MMTRKRKIGLLITACLLTVGIASTYAAGSNPFDTLTGAFDDFQAEFQQMWTRIDIVEDKVATIQFMEKIAELEARIVVLEAGGGTQGPPGPKGEKGDTGSFGAPDYDSGWLVITDPLGKEIFEHNLDTTDLFVYMIGKDTLSSVHQWYYGGNLDYIFLSEEHYYDGAAWSTLNSNTVEVFKFPDDGDWYEVRVLIWQLPPLPP